LKRPARTQKHPLRLHPNLAEIYRQKVATVIEALAAEDGADAKDVVRSLIDAVILHPDGDHQRVEGGVNLLLFSAWHRMRPE
jgi:hypothetical protein